MKCHKNLRLLEQKGLLLKLKVPLVHVVIDGCLNVYSFQVPRDLPGSALMGGLMNVWFLTSDQKEGMAVKTTGPLSQSSSGHREKQNSKHLDSLTTKSGLSG